MGVDYEFSAIATVVATGALLPLAVLPIVARTVRRFGRLRGWPMVAAFGLIASTVALAAYTVFPLPDASQLACTRGRLTDYWITDPKTSIAPFVRLFESDGFVAMLRSDSFEQFFLNIMLFLPFGFFLHHVTRWNAVAVTAAGFLVSAGIEVTQGSAFFRVYPCPYRNFDVADMIANTGGAFAGALFSVALVFAVPAATPTPVPDLAPPTAGRRAIAWTIDLALIATLAAGAVGAVTLDRAVTYGEARAWGVVADRGHWVIAIAVATALVAIFHPLVRRDRATPGQAVVNIGSARAASPDRHAALWQVLVRWALRWLPWALAPILPVLPAAVLVAEVITTLVTPEGRSLAGLTSRTVTRTLPSFARRLTPRREPSPSR